MEKLTRYFKAFMESGETDSAKWVEETEYGVINTGAWLQYWTREYPNELVVSKRFRFIQRLVKNNAISIQKLSWLEIESKRDFEEMPENEEISEEHWIKYYTELTIMLLSIQDRPVDVLESLLI